MNNELYSAKASMPDEVDDCGEKVSHYVTVTEEANGYIVWDTRRRDRDAPLGFVRLFRLREEAIEFAVARALAARGEVGKSDLAGSGHGAPAIPEKEIKALILTMIGYDAGDVARMRTVTVRKATLAEADTFELTTVATEGNLEYRLQRKPLDWDG